MSGRQNRYFVFAILLVAVLRIAPQFTSGYHTHTEGVRDRVSFEGHWSSANPAELARVMLESSGGDTDKVDDAHGYETLYFNYITSLLRKLDRSDRTLSVLEIGLGCGMRNGLPGGSVRAWQAVFKGVARLELHVLEYAEDCARKWANENPNMATVHVGDSGSADSLETVVKTIGKPLDIIIDDGSHINEHQINALKVLGEYVAPGGFYVIEDIMSSCRSWPANLGTYRGKGVGGTSGCLRTKEDKPTIFSELVDLQKTLVLGKNRKLSPWEHISIFSAAAVLKRDDTDQAIKWRSMHNREVSATI